MIQMGTRLKSADNTGAQELGCVKVLGGSGKNIAKIGDVIVVSVKKAIPTAAKAKKGEVFRAVVVRTTSPLKRSDGSFVHFSENAVVLLDKQNQPIATRIFGPVPRELRSGFMKLISLAPEVV